MVNDIKSALLAHKKGLESSWTDTLSVYEQENVFDPITKTKKKTEVIKLVDVPCKLSYKNSVSSAKSDSLVSTATKQAELFTSVWTEIKAGSKIVVMREATEIEFSRSGEPDIHFSHRRYALERFKGYL